MATHFMLAQFVFPFSSKREQSTELVMTIFSTMPQQLHGILARCQFSRISIDNRSQIIIHTQKGETMNFT